MWTCYDWDVVVVRQWTQYVVVLWLGCRCCLRLSIQFWWYYDWGLLTEDNNDNPIIIRPHIIFTDGRQGRQPNHNTTTYCVYWGCRCCLPSVNTICGRVMIGMSLSSVSEHNMWSCYDWVVFVVFHFLTQYLVYWHDNNDNPIIIRPHIVFTDWRQRQLNHNTTTYCVYWRTTTTTTQS
jgi:hypothetical protein